MNYYTQLSIELASQRDYLDQLFRVYPLSPDFIREIDRNIWNEITEAYDSNDNIALFSSLLKLNLFPIKDGYVPFFKLDKTAIERNPQTINRICGRIRELGLNKLYEKCTQPKETNRQMEPLFHRWVNSGALGINPISEEQFLSSSDNAILEGGDNSLRAFAERHLGYKRKKGIDFIGRFNGKYIIGEAKFISDEGGHQNAQFLDAMQAISSKADKGVIKIAILDGVLYIKSKKNMYKTITSRDLPVMSALLLRDYLYSL